MLDYAFITYIIMFILDVLVQSDTASLRLTVEISISETDDECFLLCKFLRCYQ